MAAANANTTPVNNLGNWAVGQLYPNWELPLTRTDANGNVSRVMDLTGVQVSQLSLIIYTAAKVVAANSPGAGSFAINRAKPAVVTYSQATADMATAGTYYVRVRINFNGATPDYSDYVQIVIGN